jgi:NAD(P)H-dependent FMN reductase
MTRIAVIIGSTRPGRRAPLVGQWAYEMASQHTSVALGDASVELVDIADYDLPLLDEPVPPAIGQSRNPHTLRWAETIASFDGFVFVTPEYNHSIPAALKNAIDFLYKEWNDKAAGFVSYGVEGGTRAVEHLRLTLAEVKVACVRSHVSLSLFSDFQITDRTKPGVCTPGERQAHTLNTMLDELVTWASALESVRGNVADVQTVGA